MIGFFLLNSEGTENYAKSIRSEDMMQIKHYAWNQIRENMRRRSLTSEKIYKKPRTVFSRNYII